MKAFRATKHKRNEKDAVGLEETYCKTALRFIKLAIVTVYI